MYSIGVYCAETLYLLAFYFFINSQKYNIKGKILDQSSTRVPYL